MKKKATTRRKARPGASKAPKRRRKASVKGAAAPAAVSSTTKTFGGKRFTKVACGMTKTDAKKRAENTRKAGKLARVVANAAGKGFCIYTRGK
jgi:hypothetical protein